MFQSTHSRGVRLFGWIFRCGIYCFNPRTHEECDIFASNRFLDGCKFQSTHSRGVRLPRGNTWQRRLWFQSTHSRGVRRAIEIFPILIFRVSIHALTRSATPHLSSLPPLSIMFQSTHSRGVRQTAYKTYPSQLVFQSTHSRGVRLPKSAIFHSIDEFQSTHSRGVRPHIFFLFYFQIFRTRFSRIFLKNIKSKR